jgi:Holliday junction resolvasome RuvABC endonuclease subunit
MIIAGLDLSMNGSGAVKFILDDKLNIVEKSHLAFCSVKKNANDYVKLYKRGNYPDRYAVNIWMETEISDFIKDCSHIAIEDYAFGASGNNFDIGEFIGYVKTKTYENQKAIRLYDPNSIKKFAAGKGNADKISMYQAFIKVEPDMLSDYPAPNKGSGVNPTSDIVDAYWIAQLLRLELQLRKGHVMLNSLSEEAISIFNRCTKSNPINLLDREFICKKT